MSMYLITSFKIHEAKADKTEGRNRQIHKYRLIFNISLTKTDRTSLQEITRDREDSTLQTRSKWHLWNTPPSKSRLPIHFNAQEHWPKYIMVWYN